MSRPVVVVAAHPDDETIGAASLLLAAPRAAVVHLTDGAPRDPRWRPEGRGDREAYARRRREEALAALEVAGLAARDVVCLGAVDQEAAASIAPLARALADLLAALRPRLVVTHALEGGHPDHDAAAVAARAALVLAARRTGETPPLWEMAGYHAAGGSFTAGAFVPGTPAGRPRRLSPAERAAKARMVACYASQRAVLAPFDLGAERFRRAPPLALDAPPHARPLHYEAMGWTTWEAFRALAAGALAALGLGPARAGAAAAGATP